MLQAEEAPNETLTAHGRSSIELGARPDRSLVHAVASAAIARRLGAEASLLRTAEEGVRALNGAVQHSCPWNC